MIAECKPATQNYIKNTGEQEISVLINFADNPFSFPCNMQDKIQTQNLPPYLPHPTFY